MNEKKKVEIRINGMDYTLVSTEEPEYVHRIGHFVDEKMKEILSANPRLSTAMAAVLTSVNIADEYLKSVEAADNMRTQVQTYIEENFNAKQEIGTLQQECDRLREELQTLKLRYVKKETQLEDVVQKFELGMKNDNVSFDDLK